MSKRRFFLLGILPAVFIFSSPKPAHADVSNAVVKVFVTANPMNYYRPWQSQGSQSSTGSGTVISGNRILTNAHVVNNNTFIQVRKESDPTKYTARLEAIGFDCDIAILTVDDPEFFKDITPLEFGDLPQLQDSVIVVGFPLGGDKISVTKGVVSRIESVGYAQSSKQLLAVQIDAAINPGNSGGPVLHNGKLAGIAMQVISSSQNIGYIIPIEIINHFLNDLQDGNYDGFPTLGVDFRNTENKSLREFYSLQGQKGGVVVSRVLPYSPAHGQVQEEDVLLAIDGIPIEVDGSFQFREKERLSLSYLINKKQIGDTIDLKISRVGKIQQLKFKMTPFVTLIPHPNYIPKPSYYIYGGLVFTVLSMDLLGSWGNEWWEKAPLDFLHYLIGNGRFNDKAKKEVVVLLEVLPDNINIGYHGNRNEVIERVNGQPVNSFQEFVRLLEKQKEPYTIFETVQHSRIILKNQDIPSISQSILIRNNIPAQYSDDVKAWLDDPHIP